MQTQSITKEEVKRTRCIAAVSSFVLQCLEAKEYPSSGKYASQASENGWPSFLTLAKNLGADWKEILEASGFDLHELPNAVTLETCLGDVADFVFECVALNKYPATNEYVEKCSERGWVCYSSLREHTDIYWDNILQAAGFNLHELPHANQLENCLGDIAEFALECLASNRVPTSFEFQKLAAKRGWVGLSTIHRNLKVGWNELLLAAGFEIDEIKDQKRAQQATSSVKAFLAECEKNEQFPTASLFAKLSAIRGWVSYNQLRRISGSSWHQILIDAGYSMEKFEQNHSLEKCIEHVTIFVNECLKQDVYPSTNKYQKQAGRRGWTPYPILQRFIDHKWDNILSAVGFDPQILKFKRQTQNSV